MRHAHTRSTRKKSQSRLLKKEKSLGLSGRKNSVHWSACRIDKFSLETEGVWKEGINVEKNQAAFTQRVA